MQEKEVLKFYIVNEDYIEYLRQYDNHVSWNKEEKRPYIGIVLKIENYLYFAPLYSYKASYEKYKNNSSFIRIEDRKGKFVSILRFSQMIPVPTKAIKLLDFNSRGDKYRDLLEAENDFINHNREIIYSKARKTYKNVVKAETSFFKDISCDFKLLEQKSNMYAQEKHTSNMKVSLIQMNSHGPRIENENKAMAFLNEAIKDKPDIICLSEKFLAWGKDKESGNITIDEIDKYVEFAKKNEVNLVLGSVALKSNVENKTTNTCFIINRNGKIVKRYDKKYMYKVIRNDLQIDEFEKTIPGNNLGIVELDGVKIGVGICFDIRFPEYFRELIKNGAQIIFLPAHFRKSTGEKAWEVLTIARAIENQVYFCACNQTGEYTCGKTRIVSYNGDILKQIENGEGIITENLSLEHQDNFRKELPVIEQM